MLPGDGDFSSPAIIAGSVDPVKRPGDFLVDWERGGINLNDPSQGLLVQIWKLEVVRNPDTANDYDFFVTSPSTGTLFLFTAQGVKEAALAFDQNMRPFVVYVEGTQTKMWWYDPTLPGQTTTVLGTGYRSPRCCTDEKRPWHLEVSDVQLWYVRGTQLCVRYQRERYTIEHPKKTVGSQAELISVTMATNNRLRLRLRKATLPIDDQQAMIRVNPILAEIVEDLCIRSGIPAERIDVRELYDDEVPGLKISLDEGLDKPIDWLRDMFFFDKSEYDGTIHFPKRGRNVVARIPYADLVRGEPVALKKTVVDESKLPREVTINHLDPEGGYAKNHQTAQRRSNLVKAEGKKKLDTQIVLTPDQAATVAATKLKAAWREQVSYKFATTIKWTQITTGDVIEVQDSTGDWFRMHVDERNEEGTNINWECTQDGGYYAYNGIVTGNKLRPPVSTTPGLIGETDIDILNIPVQRDQNDELGVYIAGCGVSSGWAGYTMFYSLDGVNFSEAYTVQAPSTMGETLTDLLAERGYENPGHQTVEVLVNFPLSSITEAQMFKKGNRAVIGEEVLQFQTATLLGRVDSKYRYALSGLLRGTYATATPHWPAGTRFVLMDETLVFVQLQRGYLGNDLSYKPVSLGQTLDETVQTDYLFDEGVSQTEWPVSRVEAVRVGSDVTVSWIGAARLGFDSAPYHSKWFRGYRVKFSDGHTIDTLQLTATYTGAPSGVTVQVCGLNEITGEGPYSPALAT
ncbi:central tail fiber receptor binding protein [Stenotrophomonas phage Sonora]|nr:central tail fiber receptor binding protein [Stenotrophomonas phage Sonora]